MHPAPTDDHQLTHEHAHPGAKTYIQVAVILAVITIVEVAIFYIQALRPLLIPLLLGLSAVKFVLVVGYYMHLKFDDWFFLRVFGFALLIAMTIATAFIALFHGMYF